MAGQNGKVGVAEWLSLLKFCGAGDQD